MNQPQHQHKSQKNSPRESESTCPAVKQTQKYFLDFFHSLARALFNPRDSLVRTLSPGIGEKRLKRDVKRDVSYKRFHRSPHKSLDTLQPIYFLAFHYMYFSSLFSSLSLFSLFFSHNCYLVVCNRFSVGYLASLSQHHLRHESIGSWNAATVSKLILFFISEAFIPRKSGIYKITQKKSARERSERRSFILQLFKIPAQSETSSGSSVCGSYSVTCRRAQPKR